MGPVPVCVPVPESWLLPLRVGAEITSHGNRQWSPTGYSDGPVRTFFAAGLKTKAGHSTTWRADSFKKQPAINPESMTNPNTAAIMVSPKSREVMTATLMMMIFFILLTPFW